MAVDSNMFLEQFFEQLYFDRMTLMYPLKFKTFKKYVDNGDYKLRGDMKLWHERLYHPDADGNQQRGFTDGTSGAWAMSDKAWEELYIEFRNAFRDLYARQSEFDGSVTGYKRNSDVMRFLNDNFGPDKLFYFAGITKEAEDELNDFADKINNNKEISEALNAAFDQWGIKEKSQNLARAIKDGTYKSDIKTQETIRNIMDTLKRHKSYVTYYDEDATLFEVLDREGLNTDFDTVLEGFDDKKIDEKKLKDFKEGRYQQLLELVAVNKDINKQFRSEKIIKTQSYTRLRFLIIQQMQILP